MRVYTLDMSTSKTSERVVVYIDGGNFYRRLKEVKDVRKGIFNYTRFVEFLIDNRTLVSKRYYVGIVRNIDDTAKSKRMVENQQKFLTEIEKEGFVVKRGRIVYTHGIREKGVDVKLATDLIIGAVDNLYDTAIVVSSDTDLIPALKYISFRRKKIEYVGFSHKPSLGIIKNADSNILLRSQEIQMFKT